MPDFVKMPDGSLIMVGTPKAQPSAWERFKATVKAIPDRFRPKPAPWWIAQPQAPVVQAREVQVPVMQQTAQQLLAPPPGAAPVNDFEEAEKEANKRAAIVKQLGDVPRNVLASEFFVGRER